MKTLKNNPIKLELKEYEVITSNNQIYRPSIEVGYMDEFKFIKYVLNRYNKSKSKKITAVSAYHDSIGQSLVRRFTTFPHDGAGFYSTVSRVPVHTITFFN